MYEFMKTPTGWRIYWGPPPREESRVEPSGPVVVEAAVAAFSPVVATAEMLAMTCRA
jgi:hypothetical protein